MNLLPPIRTLDDINRATIVETVNGRTKTRILCGADASSIEAFARIAPPRWTAGRSSLTERTDYGWGSDFYACRNYPEAVALLRNGWTDGLNKIADMAGRLAIKSISGKRERVYYRANVAPGVSPIISIPNVVAGHPCQFINQHRATERSHGANIIRIAYNVAASGSVNSPILTARGAAVFALIEALERQRKTVELTVHDAYHSAADDALSEWHVQPAGARLQKSSLAFALANADTLRRIMFAMLEHHPNPRPYFNGYGSVGNVQSLFPKEYAKYDIVVDSMPADADGSPLGAWTDESTQIAWVKSQLSKFGISA